MRDSSQSVHGMLKLLIGDPLSTGIETVNAAAGGRCAESTMLAENVHAAGRTRPQLPKVTEPLYPLTASKGLPLKRGRLGFSKTVREYSADADPGIGGPTAGAKFHKDAAAVSKDGAVLLRGS